MAFLARTIEIDPRARFPVASAAIFGLAFLPLVFGSLATVLYFVVALFALIAVIARRRFAIAAPAGFAVLACLLYFGLDAVSFLYPRPSEAWVAPVNSLHFALFPIVIAGIAGIGGYDPLRSFVLGARAGAIGAAILAALQMADGMERAIGGMINPIPFGATAMLFAFIGLIGTKDERWTGRIIALVAFGAGAGASALSQSRGAWLAAPVLGLILIVYLRARFGTRPTAIAVGLLVVMAGIIAVAARDRIADRIAETAAMFQAFGIGKETGDAMSLDQRALMMRYGLDAAGDRLLLGYGPQNIMEEVRKRATTEGETIDPIYRHLHNEFLTETASNGLLGLATLLLVLAAPIVTAWKARKRPGSAERLGFAAMLVAGPVIFGQTSLAFGHDITNSVYVGGLVALTLSAIAALRLPPRALPPAE